MNTSGYFSGSGNFSGSGEMPPPLFIPYFPCRAAPYSKDSVAPFVWGLLPQLEHARWYVATIEAIFFIVGLTWNIFILACYIKKPKLLKEPANIYLLNLAVTDILLSVFVTLTCLVSEGAGEFVFGSSDFTRCIYCKFLGVMMHTLVILSLHTLTALSVDRCMLFSQPIHYKSIFTWKSAIVILICLWIVSIGVSIPPLFGFGDYEFNLAFGFCNARWTGENSSVLNIYYVLFYSLEAIIPIIILIFTNIWIIKIVKSVLKKHITRRRSFRGSDSHANDEERKYQNQQKQLMRVFGALFIGHIMCWLPVLTVMFLSLGIGADKIPPEVFVAGWLSFLTNPVIHPIIETFFVKDLRYRMNKTKKNVRSSLKRAQRQVNPSSLFRTLSQRNSSSNLLSGNRPPSLSQSRKISTEKSEASGTCNLKCTVEHSYLKDQAFGHLPMKDRTAPFTKKKSTVSFTLGDDKELETLGNGTPGIDYNDVFSSPQEDIRAKLDGLEKHSSMSDVAQDSNIEARTTEK